MATKAADNRAVWDWRKGFTSQTLELGKRDEEAEKLESFTCDPDGSWARGTTLGGFTVEVKKAPVKYADAKKYPNWNHLHGGRMYGDPDSHFSNYYQCTCASGMIGTRCRHLANLLLHWEKVRGPFVLTETEEERNQRLLEEEAAKLKTVRMTVYEFFQKRGKAAPAGLSFSPNRILKDSSFQTNGYEAKLAEHFCSPEFPASPEMEIGYDYAGEQILKASGMIADESVEMSLSHEKIVWLRCSCGRSSIIDYRAWYYNRGNFMCCHALGFWYHLRERIIRENPGDLTDARGNALLRLLSAKGAEEAVAQLQETLPAGKREDLQLIPRITQDKDNDMKLTFDLSRKGERSYAIRGLEKLVAAVEGEKEFALSKAAAVNFAQETFEEDSKKWYRMILSRIRSVDQVNQKLNRSRGGYFGYYTPSKELTTGGGIPLAESDLDILYDMTEGGEIQYQYGGRRDVDLIPVGEVQPRIHVLMRPYRDGNQVTGVELCVSMPKMLQGNLHQYVLDSNGFGRVSGKEVESLKAFRAAGGQTPQYYTCIIGLKKLPEFYYRILPGLQEAKEIILQDEVGSKLEGLLPPEGSFTFYLDMAGEKITCKTTVAYDLTPIVLGFGGAQTGKMPRDLDQENRVMKTVRLLFPQPDPAEEQFTTPATEENVLRILMEGIQALSAFGEVRGTDAFHQVRVRPMPQPRLSVEIEGGLLDLSIETKDMTRQELLGLLDSYRKKKRWYRLKNGDYVDLRDADGLRELEETAQAMDVSMEELVKGGVKMPKYRSLYVDKLLEDHDELAAARNREFKALIRSFRTIQDSDYDVPANLTDVIRPYQQYGFRWLCTLGQSGFGGILADEMGLGKTLQMLAWFQMKIAAGETDPGLVVCPASLVYNWLEECRKFAPSLTAEALAGNLPARKKIIARMKEGKGVNLYVTSYDLLKRDITLYDGMNFSVVILDEAQYVKNHTTAVAKAVKVLKANQRFALTGTPIENRLSELWSIFDFLMPGFLYTAPEFAERFEGPIMKRKDETATQKLARMTEPFILRRKKADVLKELPEKLEKTQRASMEEDQRRLYDAQVVHMKEMLATSANTGEDKIKILAEITRLRQLCCDPSLLFENYKGSSAKREACLELIHNAIDGGHRMLLFSQFTSMLSLLAEDLKADQIPFYTITGATPKQERLKLVNDFNNGDVPVFLISLKAGGTGLNLTGADVVIHYDPWWNLAVQNQATDRAHRIGQTRQVTVVKLIASATIEEKILELQEAKRELAEAIITGETNSLMSLSREELLALLES